MVAGRYPTSKQSAPNATTMMICNPNWLMMRVLGLFEQLRQFRDIDRDPPRLTAREQLGQMSAFPSKADIGTRGVMSALCQKRTFCAAAGRSSITSSAVADLPVSFLE